MPVSINGTNGLVFSDGSTQGTAAPGRNRLINGAMQIDQRNAGASVTASAAGPITYTLDRWAYLCNPGSKFSVQQNAGSVTPPVGFPNYLGATSLSAYSVGASEYQLLIQRVEGFNFADAAWGTANAKTVALSFRVRSSLTGNFGGVFRNGANNRFYPFSYTINAANTWETKTVIVPGDTSGTWVGATNGVGVDVIFSLGTGSTLSGTAGAWTGTACLSATGATSVVGTNGATFYITGVQLEVSASSSDFEHRPYGNELALCQRYYETSFNIGVAPANGVYSVYLPAISHYIDNLNSIFYINYKATKRASPTVAFYGGSSGKWQTMKTDGTWGTILGSTYVTAGNAQGFCGQNSDWNGSSSWQTITAGTGRMARGDWAAEIEL
jgi:hypothetical protein